MTISEPAAHIPERLVENVTEVSGRIRAAAERAGRDPEEVTLVAVTKKVPREVAWLLPRVGIHDAGENRIRAAEEKLDGAPGGLRWHFIGHLQRNKARKAILGFSVCHSVDSERLLRHMDRVAGEEGLEIEALVQVNISGEDQKHGLAVEEVRDVLGVAAGCAHVRVRGLMGMGPYTPDPEECRPVFRTLRAVRDDANREAWYREPVPELSMGMTNDFEVAVEEGATLLRIGTAIFAGVSIGSGSDPRSKGE